MLHAFFDESGTHAGSPVTAIGGFIGSRNQWRAVNRKWRKTMGEHVFHYKEMRMEGAILSRLSDILANSDLEVIGSGFVGNWERAINSGAADWPKRFPSCYHLVFEMAAQRMQHISKSHWNGEPISITFSRQDEYAKRAEEVWRTYRGNGMWESIVHFSYGAPEDLVELQAADMIAHETFQCLKEGAAGGWGWDKWPLVRKLIDNGRPLHGLAQKEEQLVQMLSDQDRNGRVYLKTVAKATKA